MQLVVVQRAAPFGDLAVDEHAQERVVRLAPQAVEALLEVLAGLAPRSRTDLRMSSSSCISPMRLIHASVQYLICGRSSSATPIWRPITYSGSGIANCATHSQRPAVDEVVDQPVRELLDQRVEPTDRGRAEREVEEAALACAPARRAASRLGARAMPFSSYSFCISVALEATSARCGEPSGSSGRIAPCCPDGDALLNRSVSSTIARMSS